VSARHTDTEATLRLDDAPFELAPLSRRERKKERTRREIYRAAMKLFARRGFDAVTIENICDEADVARGTFFLHFPTKSALLFEFHRLTAAAFAERLQGPRVSAAEELRRLVDLLSESWRRNADVMTAMLREALANPTTIEAAQKDGRELQKLIEEIVMHGQAVGEFRETIHPRVAATVFLSTSSSILAGHVFNDGEPVPSDLKHQLVEVLLHGLVVEPGTPRRRARR
jgi:AcrR family transcriptional regulator